MNRDKQIEEMSKDISKKQQGGWRFVIDDYTTDVDNEKLAEHLYNAGYRKASDVAREIFEEIETILDRHSISYLKVGQICGEHYYDGVMQFDIAEIRKKYAESEKNNVK